jgi:hypothetical protein
VAVLALLAVALTAVRISLGPLPAEDRDEVLALSERFAVALATYDHADLGAQAREIRTMSTGDFREEYEESLGSDEVASALVASGSTATATVVDGPFLASLQGASARTLTVLEQTLDADGVEVADVRTLQVELSATRTPDGWRVDGVELH